MRKINLGKKLAAATLLFSVWAVPLAAFAQTRIVAPKNKYKVEDDIKLGNDAAGQIEKQFPILNDADATRYVESVGQKLVAAIPTQFRQPNFDYRFKVVNASDINAFALPGGPMFVDRGMIEAARNEGEMAGVMAHEISHVALRHATAQATKQRSLGNQLGMLGMIIGGAVLAGEAGAQMGALGAAAWMTKYSREFETQADVLGAQIMTDADYDPRDLANMFKTIQQQSNGARAPQWLSDHPDPGNRYEKINREATLLNVSPNPIKITRGFERVQARLRAMPKARTMAEIEKGIQSGGTNQTNPTANGRYSANVQYPSARVRAFSTGNGLTLNIPTNWREFSGSGDVQFAPDGAYGDQGITRGVMIGTYRGQRGGLDQATKEYVDEILQGNSYLRSRGGYSRTYIDGRQAYSTVLSGQSPITGMTEVVTVYTVTQNSGELFYAVTVVPQNESSTYASTFRNVIGSIRLSN